jgi:hypothetical protein
MSYSAVVPMTVSYTDGTPLFTVHVPVEDVADTLSQRLWPLWGNMVDESLYRVDGYLQQKWMPVMRAETTRVSEDAYNKASSALIKTGIGLTILTAGVLGGLYWYGKKSR